LLTKFAFQALDAFKRLVKVHLTVLLFVFPLCGDLLDLLDLPLLQESFKLGFFSALPHLQLPHRLVVHLAVNWLAASIRLGAEVSSLLKATALLWGSSSAIVLKVEDYSQVGLELSTRILDVNIVLVDAHHRARRLLERGRQDLIEWYHSLPYLLMLATCSLVHEVHRQVSIVKNIEQLSLVSLELKACKGILQLSVLRSLADRSWRLALESMFAIKCELIRRKHIGRHLHVPDTH